MTKKKLSNTILSKDKLVECYQTMLLIRRFEEKTGQLYGMGLVGGFCHLYIGQEAVVVGLVAVSDKDNDNVITSYRDHGHMLALGTKPEVIFAELMGRATGCSKGKGGSMHMFDIPNRFYGGHGIVGAQVPIGTGLALTDKYKKKKSVSFTYLGDGAINQGQVYESFNMASLWKLPVLYVVENNEYAMGTSVSRSSSGIDLFRRGESLGISGTRINGMDLFEIVEKCQPIVDDIRKKQQPFIVEMKTYRYRGHSMSDPAKYRSKEEVSNFKENMDSIGLVKKYLLEHGICNEKELKDFDKKIRSDIEQAVERAKSSPVPEEEELYTDVYF